MNLVNALPPTNHHDGQRITTHRAQQLLARFLDQTATDASLHPNALLTENGPITPSSGSTGLVLHNLKRVEAGLRGEHLAADLSFKTFGGEGLPNLMGSGILNSDLTKQHRKEGEIQDFQEDWQDKDEYEREQAIEQGEIGQRNCAFEDLTPDQRLHEDRAEVPAVKRAGGSKSMVNDRRKQDPPQKKKSEPTAAVKKDERKQKKKAKQKQERRARELQKQSSAKASKSA
ncbi:MAG: hypothetical protein L6R37_003686 [Teloschistes peruensis]|nr:MAG: hypothetical protein L6R37_003686 [Teloschistes peruensis]